MSYNIYHMLFEPVSYLIYILYFTSCNLCVIFIFFDMCLYLFVGLVKIFLTAPSFLILFLFSSCVNELSRKKIIEYNNYLYVKPYARFHPCLVGLVFGYLWQKGALRKNQLNWVR